MSQEPTGKRWSLGKKILAAVLLVVLAAGGYLGYWALTGRFLTVQEGHLYRSAALSPERLVRVCERYGIRTVVDFRREKDKVAAEAATLERIGVRHLNLPSDQVPTPDVTAAFLATMDDPENLPVLVHCTHGVGRTGVAAAIYRMEYQGWSNTCARMEAMVLSGFDSFGKNTDKGRFLEVYTPRRKRPASGG